MTFLIFDYSDPLNTTQTQNYCTYDGLPANVQHFEQ